MEVGAGVKDEPQQPDDGFDGEDAPAEPNERRIGRSQTTKRKLVPNAAATTGIHSVHRKKPFCAWSSSDRPRLPANPPSASNSSHRPSRDDPGRLQA